MSDLVILEQHLINESDINDAYLKEMGCDVVGERIALLEDLRQLQAESRRAWRKQILFKQDEYRLGPCYGFLPFRCWFLPFCCDPCVPVAEKYMVSSSIMTSYLHQSLLTLWSVAS